MSESDARTRVLKRIRKVLALTTSSEPGEAAAALHQATKLMEAHGITQAEIDAAEVAEYQAALSSAKPSEWEGRIASLVVMCFSVQAMRAHYTSVKGKRTPRGHITFVGRGPNAAVAGYAFEFLRKQMRQDLHRAIEKMFTGVAKDFTSGERRRWRDAYALGWCASVYEKVQALLPKPPEDDSLNTHIQKMVEKSPVQKKRIRREKPLSSEERYFAAIGIKDGSQVQIHQGVNGAAVQSPLAIAA